MSTTWLTESSVLPQRPPSVSWELLGWGRNTFTRQVFCMNITFSSSNEEVAHGQMDFSFRSAHGNRTHSSVKSEEDGIEDEDEANCTLLVLVARLQST